jgi:hypothetical protein
MNAPQTTGDAYLDLEETITALYYTTKMTQMLVEATGFGVKNEARWVDGRFEPAGLDGTIVNAIYSIHSLAHDLFKAYQK